MASNYLFGVIYEGGLGDMAYHAVVYVGHGTKMAEKRIPFRFKDCRERMMSFFEAHHVYGVYEI